MEIRKTRQDQRGVYRYEMDVPDGRGGYRKTYNTFKPGEDGVTEVLIQELHRMDDIVNNTDALIEALQVFRAERLQRMALEEENAVQKQQLVEMKPKASYYNEIIPQKNCGIRYGSGLYFSS